MLNAQICKALIIDVPVALQCRQLQRARVALGDLPASERGELPDFSLTSSCAVDELTLAVSLPSEDDGMIGKRSVALNERVQRGQPLIT